mgnify:CR=1 FL=1
MEENEKAYSKLEWILYIVILPLIFTVILTALLLTFLGEDVAQTTLDFAKKIPGINRLVADGDGQQEEMEEEADIETMLAESQLEIEALHQEVDKKDEEIIQLREQISKLEEQLEEKVVSTQERQAKLKELATIYENMTPKRAASVLENLTPNEAALLIKQMPNRQRSAIMEKLTPEKAALITVILQNEEKSEAVEVAALQERIQLLIGSMDGDGEPSVTMQQLVNTLSQMPVDKSSELLSEMSKSNEEFQLALKILALMNDSTRSGVLAAMDTNIARNYLTALAN